MIRVIIRHSDGKGTYSNGLGPQLGTDDIKTQSHREGKFILFIIEATMVRV